MRFISPRETSESEKSETREKSKKFLPLLIRNYHAFEDFFLTG